MKFDCIVGNPPYQEMGESGKSIAGAGRKLWANFVKKSIISLKDDGYLSIVNPSGWRSIMNPLWKEIYQVYQISDVVLAPKVGWSAGVIVDHYLIQKIPYSKPTSVTHNGQTRLVDFRKVKGLVLYPTVDKILDFDGDKIIVENTQTHHHTREHVSDGENKKFCFPLKHTGASELKWSSKKHQWQNRKKVLISYTGYLCPIYDSGKLGTTQHCHAIFVSSKVEADYIIRLLNSKLYKFVQSNTKTSGFNDIKILNLLPYPKGLSGNFTDADLYAHFNLTDDEIKLVESAIKDFI